MNNFIYKKLSTGIVISLGLLFILLINMTSSKHNLEMINVQNQLVFSQQKYEIFQNKTKLLKYFKTDSDIFNDWIEAKDIFVQNFKLMLELDNSNGTYEDNYKQILLFIEKETKIVEWSITDIIQNESYVIGSDFSNIINKDLDIAINNLNMIISESLSKDMGQLYNIISDYQKRSYIQRSTITTISSISIILIMLLLLHFTIEAYRNKELEYLDRSNKTLNATLKMLAYQVELRDSLTSLHLIRTSKYVRIIAEELTKNEKYKDYISENYIKDLEKASVLHDIGKISIPDKILHKESRLTIEEFNEVKKHCKAGGDTLRLAKEELPFENFLDLAIRLTESHHEHWDGNGYPNNLSGNDIPLCGRIMTIADVYDALRSKRVYKDEMDHKSCFEYILSKKGSQFDPEIVEVFATISDKVENISNEI